MKKKQMIKNQSFQTMKKIKNWKKFNESLILERSNLSQYFTKEEVSKLHKENEIPHDVELEEITSKDELEKLLFSDGCEYRDKKVIVKLKDGSVGVIKTRDKKDLKIVLDQFNDIEKILVYKDDSWGNNPARIMRDKKRSRSVESKLNLYFKKYFEFFERVLLNYFVDKKDLRLYQDDPDSHIDLDPNWLVSELRGFEYMDELLDFADKINTKRFSEQTLSDIMNEYEKHLLEIYGESYDKSYDEFKHDFSKYIINNKNRFFSEKGERDNYDGYSDLDRF